MPINALNPRSATGQVDFRLEGDGHVNIGIIGTGHMGKALGTRWARSGHHVLFGSRDPQKAAAAAAGAGQSARAGGFEAAAEHGEVVLYTVRDVLPSVLFGSPGVLSVSYTHLTLPTIYSV